MKLTRLGPEAVFHRYLTPRWSHDPLSGAGAALHGGRFNRPGVPALYLSLEPEVALAEYKQGSSIVQPATLAAYIADLAVVADLSTGFDPVDWPAAWAKWNSDWRWIARVEKGIPPSWLLGDAVIRAGCAGLLFPSTQYAGGTNIVVFGNNFTNADSLAVHDPDGRLPTDAKSWPAA